MPLELPASLLESFTCFEVSDPSELGASSRVTTRFPASNNVNTYTLRERGVSNVPVGGVLSRFAMRPEGDLLFALVEERLATAIGIHGVGASRFCLTMMLSGRLCRGEGDAVADARAGTGLAYRGSPGQRFLSTDDNRRLMLWIDAARVERTLEGLMDAPLRRPLRFAPLVDWRAPRTAALARLVGQMVGELAHPDGLLAGAATREGLTDLLARAMLTGLPHSHRDALAGPAGGPVPRHLGRAEAFMAAHADQPVALPDIAAAAGCSTRALQVAFRRFRGTTPLAALREARLQALRAALAAADAPVLATARRFGFSNATRFRTAYLGRFGEEPPPDG